MIEEVVVRNFLSHPDTDLLLEEGVNVFVGPNGAGKSSIIDAITFALFGEHTRGRVPNLVRRGSSGAEVRVRFTVAGEAYEASRGLDQSGKLDRAVLVKVERDPPGSRVIVAGERRKTEMESVSRHVEAILGMGYKELRLASIVQQGELDSVLELQPRELKELINRLVGIDDLDRAYALSRDVIDGFKERVRRDVGFSVDDVERLEEEVEELKRRMEEARGRAAELGRRMEELGSRESRLREELEAMEPLRRKAMEAEGRFSALIEYLLHLREETIRRAKELRSVLAEAPGRMEEAARATELEKELEAARRDLEVLERELEEIRGRRADLAASAKRAAELERDLARKEGELRRIEARMGEIEARRRELGELRPVEELDRLMRDADARLKELERRRGEVGKEIRNLEELRRTGRCPTCGRTIEGMDVEGRLEGLRGELGRIEEEIRDVEAGRSKIEEELRRAREAAKLDGEASTVGERAPALREEIGELRRRIEEARRAAVELGGIEEELRRKEDARRELRRRIDSAEGELRRAREASAWLGARGISGPGDLERLGSEASAAEELARRIPADPRSSELDSLALDPRSSELVREVAELRREASGYDESRRREIEDELRSIGEEKVRVSGELGSARSVEEDSRRGLEVREGALAQLRRARKYLDVYERIRRDIFGRDGRLASGLRDWAVEALSDAASEHIRMFGMGISTVQLREDGGDVGITCYGQSGRMDVEAMSGGERVAVALALRFAMARLIGGSRADFIILDEPTANLDSEHRRKLVDLVSAMGNMAGPLRQIIVITHDRETFEDSGVEASAVFSFSRGPEGSSVRRIS
ncbi:AAA family ATPase [Conexivisphaera calida]|uniref:DNA double-strand break repair Rad50 ATPase n=1 Tax=Conexivisphaera calida TaxID=1874277 RepID=A0A4V0P1M4_9ARCH|nr:SMC family ATPase [Conexivisphaera calida]BBE42230.1 DNA double-strand break repair Rad50 ATPase [Conexivisphaera calida]